jgi:thioredoxin 1
MPLVVCAPVCKPLPRSMKPAASGLIFDANEHDFREKVIEASHAAPIMVDFWAEWCPPCHALAPVLERIVRHDTGQIRLAKVDADENMKLAGHYKLRGFPTVILFKNGEERGRFSGAKPERVVREFLDEHLA